MWKLALAVVLPTIAFAAQVNPPQTDLLQRQLRLLFPTASSFSPKQTDPPHFKVFESEESGAPHLIGVAFWTTELEPLERGYDGPIKILVGMNGDGTLSGIIVAEHREPYGSFSVDTSEFAAQFTRKSIRDPFSVGDDIDAISRATMSVRSATRAVKNSARRVARLVLTPPSQP